MFRLVDDSDFSLGVVKETASWKLRPGALADASNLIFDRTGIARQRGGTTALVSGAQTAFATAIGFCYSNDGEGAIEELYGVNGKDGLFYVINKSTGAATTIGNSSTDWIGPSIVGRPARHFGFVFFPITDRGMTSLLGSRNYNVSMAGATAATAVFNSAATASVTANNPLVTLSGADTTTNIKIGEFVAIEDATHVHFGRVISIPSATTFRMWPSPTFTNAAVPINGTHVSPTNYNLFTYGSAGAGGTCVTSFQNRLLYGNTVDFASTGRAQTMDRRIYYSPLPTETIALTATITQSGANFVRPLTWPALNYVDIPGADPIVALEAVNDNELLILTTGGVVVLRGILATQTTTSAPGVTFDIFPLNTNAGCLADLSVQKTPHGIIWASPEGIMAYRGNGRIDDLTNERYHTAWRDLTRGSSFAIHGAAYVRNHYIVTGISGGTTFALAVNLDNGTIAPITPIDWFNGVARPTDLSQVFVARWWDQTGAAPSMTNGQTLRAESIFAPDTVGQTKADADGSVVAFSAKTRALTDDLLTERWLRRVSVRYALEAAGANVTVAAGSRIDTTDTAGTPTVSIGSLSNTAVLTISGQSNATPIVITTSTNHGLQTEDWVDIHGCTPNTNANGRWKITVLSNTTFSLNQSAGNGATSATGTCKKITEQELLGSGVDMGQATYLSLASSGTVNKFELHGWRANVMEVARGMGRG